MNIHKLDTDQQIRYEASIYPRAMALKERSKDRTGTWTASMGDHVVVASDIVSLAEGLIEAALVR